MFQLTEELIKESFAQLGIECDFFPVFEKEARSAYEELQRDEPDEETTEYEDTNVCFSIEQAKNFILCYVRELKKGHCIKWADAYAKSSVYWNYSDDDSAHEALQAMEDYKEKERELEVHANAINNDPVFKKRYKTLISDGNPKANELAEEYTKVYHRCVDSGKSTRRRGCSSRGSLCRICNLALIIIRICNQFCCQNIIFRYYPAVVFYYPTG